MTIRLLSSPADLTAYNAWVAAHPHGSLWQSVTWKKFQEAIGREVRIFAAFDEGTIRASALVVIDKTSFGLSTWDIPRGPLGPAEMLNAKCKMQNDPVKVLLQTIVDDARKMRSLSVYYSPQQPLLISHFAFRIRASARHEQPEATRILDLTQAEEAILAQMHPKGRYNIKVARKHGVRVEQSAATDANSFAYLAQETAKRDGFRALSAAHYRAFLENVEGSFLLIASAPFLSPPAPLSTGEGGDKPCPPFLPWRKGPGDGGKEPIAALIGTVWNKTGYYYYGASDYAHRSLMAPYLLQWEAMRYCKERGCEKYDLLGIAPLPPSPSPRERGGTNFGTSLPFLPLALSVVEGWRKGPGDGGHPWQGVSSFKEKFGGTVVSYPPEQEILLRPMLKRMLGWKRRMVG